MKRFLCFVGLDPEYFAHQFNKMANAVGWGGKSDSEKMAEWLKKQNDLSETDWKAIKRLEQGEK